MFIEWTFQASTLCLCAPPPSCTIVYIPVCSGSELPPPAPTPPRPPAPPSVDIQRSFSVQMPCVIISI